MGRQRQANDVALLIFIKIFFNLSLSISVQFILENSKSNNSKVRVFGLKKTKFGQI